MAIELSEDDRNLLDPMFFTTDALYTLWKRHRAESPVRWTQTHYGRGYWSLTSYDAVLATYLDPLLYSSQRSGPTLPLDGDMADPAKSISIQMAMRGVMLPSNDPPRHGLLRRALSPHFLPKAVQSLEPFIEKLATDLIGELLNRGECDFVNDIAAKLPMAVIFEIMQIPKEDWPFLFRMANRASAPADADYGSGSPLEARTEAVKNITAYVIEVAQARRKSSGVDLISLMAKVHVDGKPLSDEEVGLNGMVFINAGQETTRNSLSAGMAALINDPAQMNALRSDRSLLQTLPDEFVRWRSPLTHVLRTATADVELGGQKIRNGDWLVSWIGSANRDETAFIDPDRLNIARRPNAHLGFGSGDHFCLGAYVARLQLRRIMTAFLDQVETIELTGPIQHIASHQFAGFKRMPVRVTPRRLAAA